jgi:toxin ParE1/3/4
VNRYSAARLAEWDLKAIARQSTRAWGSSQGKQYIQALFSAFQLVADDPTLGHPCDSIYPGLRSIECGEHVVSYMTIPGGVRIARVLNRRMMPTPAPAPQ